MGETTNVTQPAEAMQPDIRPVELSLDLVYRHAAGQHFSRLYEGLKTKQILGIACPDCRKVYVPPRPFCGSCNRKTRDWVRVGPAGTVRAVSEVFLPVLDPQGGQKRGVPHRMVLVELDGADTLLHHVLLTSEACAIGTRVEVVFAQTPVGSIQDVLGFRLLSDRTVADRSLAASSSTVVFPEQNGEAPPVTLEERLHLPFRYSPGRMGAEFLARLGQAELAGLYCRDCAAMNLPPASFCQTCFSENQEWREVATVGTVIAVAVPEERLRLPGDVFGFALVRLDGCTGSFLHHLADRSLTRGERARLIFREKRSGASILDIKGFVAA